MPEASMLSAQEAISVIHKLRALGIDADVDLPRICVVGKQSSGKSSVMEALTGIPLPRASGTCTRCAFEISTRHFDECAFDCTVSVRTLGQDGTRQKFTLASVTNPSDLPGVLETVQRLLLNSGVLLDLTNKLQDRSASLAEVRQALETSQIKPSAFTEDIVIIDIKGKMYSDLELIDLPGLIQSTGEADEESLIGIVDDLCRTYLQQPNTLIVMCLPCNDDLDNQAVRRIAKEFDDEGLRTVGLLTKADLVPQGTEQKWTNILQAKQNELRLGYFAMRNPTQAELDKGLPRADLEGFFFKTDPLGQSLQVVAPGRCGAAFVGRFLSEQLSDMITRQLPGLRSKIRTMLEESKEELAALGESVQSHEARPLLRSIIDKLHGSLAAHIEAGGAPPFRFWAAIKEYYENLKDDCYAARPTFEFNSCVLDDPIEITLRHQADLNLLSRHGKWDLGVGEGHGQNNAPLTINGKKLPKGQFQVQWDPKCCLDDVQEACETPLGMYTTSEGMPWVATWEVEKKGEGHYWYFLPDIDSGVKMQYRKVGDSSWSMYRSTPTRIGKWWRTPLWSRMGSEEFEQSCWVNDMIVAQGITGPAKGGVGDKAERPDEAAAARIRKSRAAQDDWPLVLRFKPTVSSKCLNLIDVADRITAARGRESCLPGGPAAYRVVQQILSDSHAQWKQPMERCIDSVSKKLEHLVNDTCRDVLGKYSKVESRVVESLHVLIAKCKRDMALRATELLERQEKAPDLLTQNDKCLSDSFQAAQQFLRGAMGCSLNLDMLDATERSRFSELAAKAGLTKDPSTWVAIGDHEDAVWTAAAAHAYYKLSLQRFCDAFPRAVDDLLLRGTVRQCREIIFKDLHVDQWTDEELRNMFEADPDVERRRREAQAKVKRLEEGFSILETS
mmetsp:Transcript_120884/g.386999  ORF Transcript_120884/g.386999 Transcript_120884/m.386999 type:complete len:899 (-) Transcript_120884:51-2747(-)